MHNDFSGHPKPMNNSYWQLTASSAILSGDRSNVGLHLWPDHLLQSDRRSTKLPPPFALSLSHTHILSLLTLKSNFASVQPHTEHA